MVNVIFLDSTYERVESLCLLWRDFNGESVSTDELGRRIFLSNSIVLLAENDDKVLGFCSGVKRASILHTSYLFELEAIYVAENSRRNGCGKSLLKAVREIAAKMNCKSIHVSAKIDSVTKAFYASHDFSAYADRFILKL